MFHLALQVTFLKLLIIIKNVLKHALMPLEITSLDLVFSSAQVRHLLTQLLTSASTNAQMPPFNKSPSPMVIELV